MSSFNTSIMLHINENGVEIVQSCGKLWYNMYIIYFKAIKHYDSFNNNINWYYTIPMLQKLLYTTLEETL